MQGIEGFLAEAARIVWGPPLLILLVGTHVYLTVRLRFIQRYLGRAIRLSVTRDVAGEGDVSHFGALTTALAATIGTGNIVGVGMAVASGGPGAVFWMWLTGVLGIATKYAEAVLAIKYRITTRDGSVAGGPMYVCELGLGARWLGVVFAAFTAVAAFGIGNMVQANSVAVLAHETFALRPWVMGLVLTAATAAVILGGIRSIARVCEALVPFMAIFNIVGCLVLLAMHLDRLPGTLAIIVETAFTGQAMVGGFAGAGIKEAIRYGVARGLFSNESGLGSAAIIAAAAQTTTPVRQALVSSTGTFWDTVVMCALTGLVVVNSGAWTQGLNGAALTKAAFEDIPVVGPVVLTVGLVTFVYATILGWSYYGEKAAEYLFGSGVIGPYRWLWVAAVMVGSVVRLPAVWDFADAANGLMAVPNLVSLLLLTRVVVAETRTHLWEAERS